MSFIELALSCVLKLLPLGFLEPFNMLKEESKLRKFLFLFEKGTNTIKPSLCYIIDSASSTSAEISFMFGSSQKLLHEILLLLSQNCEASKVAMKAISALCSSETSKQNLVRARAIDMIIKQISGPERREKKKLAPLGISIVEKLVMLESGKEALEKSPNSIKALVKMVFRLRESDEECSESAVGLLLRICGELKSGREEAIEGGLVTQLLFLLQCQCSSTMRTKARRLLKLVTSM